MVCRYGEKSHNRSEFVAALGTLPTIFEERLLTEHVHEICFYTADEIKNLGLDVLECVPVEDKWKAMQDMARMAIKYGLRVEDYNKFEKLPYTHGERVEIGNEFIKEVEPLPYVTSVSIVGSVASDSDNIFSDVDVAIAVKECPGKDECEIVKIMKKRYEVTPLDLFCTCDAE